MDEIDQQLVSLMQTSFPLTVHPYQEIAEQLDISINDCLQRIQKLMDDKVIRRIGGILQSDKIGYTSTLCALHIPQTEVERVATMLNQFSSITHNYERNHEFNLWFTFIDHKDCIQQSLQELSEYIGYPITTFPSMYRIKSKVMLDVNI